MRTPYNFDALLRFLEPRAIPGVEQVTPDAYRRTLPGGWVEVRRHAAAPHLVATFEIATVRDLAAFSARLHRLFDTDADITAIEQTLSQHPRLKNAVRARPGLRVPGAWDAFELTVRAILGQQVTVKGATTLAGRIVEQFGEQTPHGMLFPSAKTLAAADLTRVGLPRTRAAAIRSAAAAFASPDPPQTIAALEALPGIGAWTAQYVAMRAFNDPDAFPATDLGLIRAAGAGLAELAEACRPWRAYAAMHLWMEHSND